MSEAPKNGLTVPVKLHLDAETGDMISKTELKKRQKIREKKKEKDEKAAVAAAATPAAAEGASSSNNRRAAGDEEELDPAKYFENRSKQILELVSTKNPDPYPHKFSVNIAIASFLKKYEELKTGETREDVEIRVGVRIMSVRTAGNSLRFLVCKGNGVTVQVFCDRKNFKGDEEWKGLQDVIHRGDHVGVVGFPGRTKPKNRDVGELSVFATHVTLLSPSLRQLPSVHYGFHNQEQRYRQRWVDLIMNDDTRDVFITRNQIIKYIRRFLEDRDFIEVETPMMNKIPGGAAALPFLTYHNALKRDLFMRVAPELYLKMLIVGGFERVYEIGRNFRNEDIDITHSPEFTSIEFYQAYADYEDLMTMTEDLFSGLVKQITGSYTTKLDKDGKTYEINWSKPFKRIKMIPALEEATGEKFPDPEQLGTDESIAFLDGVCKKFNVNCEIKTTAKLLDKLAGHFIEDTMVNPTFLIGHPQIMSPLAKVDRNTPGLTERFELFVATKEIANSYTELNNVFTQRQLFLDQAKDRAAGDDEGMQVDEDFLQALEYGLPPTAGWGAGVDRLTMMLCNRFNIREVITFPHLKDEAKEVKD